MLIDILKNRSALQRAMDDMPLPKGGLMEQWQAEGWEYGDLPRMSVEYFDKFVGIVGADNLRWLSIATYGPNSKRGQYFISPAGRENLRAYLATQTQ